MFGGQVPENASAPHPSVEAILKDFKCPVKGKFVRC